VFRLHRHLVGRACLAHNTPAQSAMVTSIEDVKQCIALHARNHRLRRISPNKIIWLRDSNTCDCILATCTRPRRGPSMHLLQWHSLGHQSGGDCQLRRRLLHCFPLWMCRGNGSLLDGHGNRRPVFWSSDFACAPAKMKELETGSRFL